MPPHPGNKRQMKRLPHHIIHHLSNVASMAIHPGKVRHKHPMSQDLTLKTLLTIAVYIVYKSKMLAFLYSCISSFAKHPHTYIAVAFFLPKRNIFLDKFNIHCRETHDICSVKACITAIAKKKRPKKTIFSFIHFILSGTKMNNVGCFLQSHYCCQI